VIEKKVDLGIQVQLTGLILLTT